MNYHLECNDRVSEVYYMCVCCVCVVCVCEAFAQRAKINYCANMNTARTQIESLTLTLLKVRHYRKYTSSRKEI